MQFLHSGVHRDFRRDLSRQVTISGEVFADVFLVECPRCGDEYFANPLGEIPPRSALAVRQAARAAARARLNEDCPDHVHRFDQQTP